MNKKWYKLDNASKLFSAVSTDRNKAVFRVSATLASHVDPLVLQTVLGETLKRFPGFATKIKKGLFWSYLEESPERLLVQKETASICESFDILGYHQHLMRVLYYHDKISIEVSHIISDGAGALEFFKVLLFYYLERIGYELDESKLLFKLSDNPSKDEWLDAFKQYALSEQSTHDKQEAFKLTGTSVSSMKVIHGSVELASMKRCASKYEASLTEFTMALMIYSIYQTSVKSQKSTTPVTISLPVNLRGFFKTITLTNFFGVVNVSVFGNKELSLKQIIELVKIEYHKKFTKENLQAMMNHNVALEEKKYAKFAPYALKEKIMRIGFSRNGESQKTTTLSNLGVFHLPKELAGSLQAINIVSYPTKNVPINASMITFNERLTLTFVRNIEEVDFIAYFFRFLTLEEGIDVEIMSV